MREHNTFLELVERGWQPGRIALQMNRSVSSIRSRMNVYGLRCRSKKPKLTDNELLKMWNEDGLSAEEIGNRTNRIKESIYKRLYDIKRRHPDRVKIRRPSIMPQYMEQVKRMYADGMSYNNIADALNLKRPTVTHAIIRAIGKGEMERRQETKND